MSSANPSDLVEARTQQVGRELFTRAKAYRPSAAERLQDWLMVRFMENEGLRNRLLRFLDVLAALDFDQEGRLVKGLAQEYFQAPFSDLPPWLRGLLRLGTNPALPAPLVAGAARWLARLMASRFIVPEDGVFAALDYLGRLGRWGSFDLLGEQVHSHQEADEYRDRYLALIDRLPHYPGAGKTTAGGIYQLQLSIKLSSLVADFNPVDPVGTLNRIQEPFVRILEAAQRQGISVNVDLEQYEYRDLTWFIFRQILGSEGPLARWDGAGLVVQAYLRDSPAHLDEVLAWARERSAPIQVRLVKGAYWDYEVIVARQAGWPVPVFESKAETDANFEALVWRLLQSYPQMKLAVASHNLRSHAYAEAVREHLGVPPGAVEHQVLFRSAEGVARAFQEMGWPVRDYVPSGNLLPGMAYLVRRVLENTSQVGFLMQSRLGEDPAKLLRPPSQTLQEPAPSAPYPDQRTFANQPPQRLFRAEERATFTRALEEVAAQRGKHYPLQLGEEEIATAEVVPSLDPSHPPDEPLGWVHFAGLAEAERAIALANQGFVRWSQTSLWERVAIARRAVDLMAQERDLLAAWEVYEGGKNWAGALADIDEAIDYLRYYSEQALAVRLSAHGEAQAGLLEAKYRPRGVVAVIPPWNFPLAIPGGMTSAALIAGNAVILKSAAPTPIVAQKLVDLLHRAGVPKDALIHLPGRGGLVGQALVESPEVDMVAFTGSKDVGISIHRAASQVRLTKGGIKRVVAEMGGKNAIVVFADADLDEAIQGVLPSAFGHANQKCSACSRVFVQRAVYARFRERLVAAAASLESDPAQHPGSLLVPLISAEAKARVLGYAEGARAQCRVLLDEMGTGEEGSNLLLPLLVELQPEQASTTQVAQEEIFGPILVLVPFDSEAQAVSLVNSTPYALTAGVYCRRPHTIRRMVRQIRAGNIYVNREITGARVGIEPFGGFQLSGTGPKAGGEDYLVAFGQRREEVRPPSPQATGAPRQIEEATTGAMALPKLHPEPAEGLRPWDDLEPEARAERLARGLKGMVASTALRQVAAQEFGVEALEKALSLGIGLLERRSEITKPRPTSPVWGQHNYLSWDTPRGVGLVIAGEASRLETVMGLLLGALVAGNGVALVVAPGHRITATLMVEELHWAGVPNDVLSLGPEGGVAGAAELARGPVHFAATDLSPDETQAVYAALGEMASGQTWLKALLSADQGPALDEPGFLRQFAHPKAVAIRTLRHGAALEL